MGPLRGKGHFKPKKTDSAKGSGWEWLGATALRSVALYTCSHRTADYGEDVDVFESALIPLVSLHHASATCRRWRQFFGPWFYVWPMLDKSKIAPSWIPRPASMKIASFGRQWLGKAIFKGFPAFLDWDLSELEFACRDSMPALLKISTACGHGLLHEAVKHKNLTLVKFLVLHGADVEIDCESSSGCCDNLSPISLAYHAGSWDIFSAMCSVYQTGTLCFPSFRNLGETLDPCAQATIKSGGAALSAVLREVGVKPRDLSLVQKFLGLGAIPSSDCFREVLLADAPEIFESLLKAAKYSPPRFFSAEIVDDIMCTLMHKFPRCHQYLTSNDHASSQLPRELALALTEGTLGLWVSCLHDQSSENVDYSLDWLFSSPSPLDPVSHDPALQLFLRAVLTIAKDPGIVQRLLLCLTEKLISLPNWMQSLSSLTKSELYRIVLSPPYNNTEDRMKVLLPFMNPEPNTDNIVNIAAYVMQEYASAETEPALRAMTSSMPQSSLNEGLASLVASTGTTKLKELLRGIDMIIKFGAKPNYQQNGCSMLDIVKTRKGYFGYAEVIACLQQNGAL
ncbi:hypothetical protein Pelo_11468 [Pelomyxa schiedti]|nr:hypothetical protein Pelo_11468 [Pelomyxa schiedti]